jgi:hypothetical protein
MDAIGLSKKMAKLSEPRLCRNMDISSVVYFIGHFIAFHSAHDTRFAVRKAVDVHKRHGNSWM